MHEVRVFTGKKTKKKKKLRIYIILGGVRKLHIEIHACKRGISIIILPRLLPQRVYMCSSEKQEREKEIIGG